MGLRYVLVEETSGFFGDTREMGMLDHLTIEPMTEEFILWRCLHDGPLCMANIEPSTNTPEDYAARKAIAIPLLSGEPPLPAAFVLCLEEILRVTQSVRSWVI